MAETRFAEAPNDKNSMLFFVEIPTNKTSEIAGWLEATMLRFDDGLLGVTLAEAESNIRNELAEKGISVFQYWLKDENFAQRVKYVFWDSNLVADFSPASQAGAYDIITASGLIGIEPFSEPIPNARFSLFLTPLDQLPLDQGAEQSSMRICQSIRLVSGICRSLKGEKIDDKQRFIEEIMVGCSNP